MKQLTPLVFRRQLKLRLYLSVLIVFLISTRGNASHIRAGEIIANRADPFQRTYEFIFVGYRDNVTQARFGNGIFSFGDGSTERILPVTNEVQISENLFCVEFRLVHTYAANGAYTVSYEEEFRNQGIANMDDSDATVFYVESQIVIDGAVGMNSTPRFTYPPIDDGKIGLAYSHNPIAFDPDEDSLSYELVIPQQGGNREVSRYRLPNASEFYVGIPHPQGDEAGLNEPTFSIDQNGNLKWDAPGDFLNLSGGIECPPGVDRCAEYNVAFKVTEWKKIGDTWRPFGFVIRDMQITISDGENEPPEIEIPDDVCVEAGTTLSEVITASDPDGHRIELSAFGGPFQVIAPATVSPSPFEFQESPAEMTFEWNTQCGHVKDSPYVVGFRANDLPEMDGLRTGPSLSDVGTWSISVIGPAPKELALQNDQEGIDVTWLPYTCANAENLQVWRRIGPYAFEPDACEVGIPDGVGYRLVGEVSGTEVAYFDDFALASGVQYCYRLVANFPLGGTSYASDEVCITLPLDTPIITHVDVAKTSLTEGEIIVRWQPSSNAQVSSTYQVLRYNNLEGTGSPDAIIQGISGLEYIDQRLNTDQTEYGYQIVSMTEEAFADTAAFASQVSLNLRPGVEEIELNWQANVPWSNQSQKFPYHYIYRNQIDATDSKKLLLIDSVRADLGQMHYLDRGVATGVPLREETRYCYYVTVQGTYENSPAIPDPLLNRSQQICSRPNDTTPPCEPGFLQIVNLKSCEENLTQITCPDEFYNELVWNRAEALDACDDEVQHYNIYFSHSGLESDYEVVASVNANAFIHRNLTSFKGCYRISAVDRSGNESALSEETCNDNYSSIELPNVFTPNEDGKNDTFIPFASRTVDGDPTDQFCDLFIDKIIFQVFDRTGKQVYTMNSDKPENSKYIQWDGSSNNGNSLPAGIYYYQANVQFDVLAYAESNKIFNGWVQILK